MLAAYKRVRDEFISRKLPAATPAAGFAAKADFLIMEEKFKAFQKKELKFGSKPEQIKKTFDSFTAEAKALNEDYQKIWNYKDATWTLASFLRTGDVYYEFAQKLIKAADNPPEDLKKLAKQACKANPDDCGVVEGQYKDAIYQFVTPVEDEAKKRWKDTLARARRSWASPTTTSRRRARTCRSTCPTSSRSSRTSASDWSTHERRRRCVSSSHRLSRWRSSARLAALAASPPRAGAAAAAPPAPRSASRRPP